MTFRPITFTYTPPPTVITPTSTEVSGITSVGGTTSSNSLAGQLISQLDDLTAMSRYLQEAILARTNQMAIEIDPAVDPDTSRALCSTYGTDTPPNAITIPMYNALLDAHLGVQQLEMSLGTNSTIQPNPIQVANLATILSAVNSHLVQAASYQNWLPLQLASLKSDAIVFQSWKDALSTYPAYYSTPPDPSKLQQSIIQATSLDMSPSIYAYQSDAITRFNQVYGNVYQSLASATPEEQDASAIMIQLFGQPLSSMIQMAGIFTSLVGLSHKPNMSTIQGDLINYTFARLASDVSGMLATIDQLVSLTVAPLKGTLGTLSQIQAISKQQTITLGIVTGGALAGLSKANNAAVSNPSNGITSSVNITLAIPNTGSVSSGPKALAEYLNWGQDQLTNGLALIDKSFRQLVEHRLNQQNDTQSLMTSMRTVDLMTSLLKGVISSVQNGTITSNPNPQQQQVLANSILTSLQTGSNTIFSTSDNQIIVNPPSMPAVTPEVERVLSIAKINIPAGKIVS